MVLISIEDGIGSSFVVLGCKVGTANPTIPALARYAEALGKKLEIVLTDQLVS